MNNKRLTFWNYFKNSAGIYATVFCIIIVVILSVQQLNRDTHSWYAAIGVLVIGMVYVPLRSWRIFKKY